MPKPENILGQGFHTNPERINKKGRPKKLISHVNSELKKEGYRPASLDEVKEAYLFLINLPISEVKNIASATNDAHPLLYKLTAKEMLGKRGMEMMEKVLDRALGKPQQHLDHTTQGEKMHQTIKVLFKADADELSKI